ncbi:MAG TPA: endonuclease III [Planktothrix sp.]|jgi:endonuclease-3
MATKKITGKASAKLKAKSISPAAKSKATKSAKSAPLGNVANKQRATKKRAIVSKATAQAAGRKKSPVDIDEKFVKAPAGDIDEMMAALCRKYPDAHCELNYKTTFQLLISVILSAQTTDTGVNRCTPKLFQRFPDAKALAEADIEEVKEIIRPTGFFNAKATNIQRCAQALVERFGGEVPKNVEDLQSLPGVGKKTANVVLGVAYGEPAWTVDTHVQRLVKRLGLTDETDPLKIEFALQKIFPKQDWSQYSITIIWHGRRICFARKPDCGQCPINHLCPSSQV